MIVERLRQNGVLEFPGYGCGPDFELQRLTGTGLDSIGGQMKSDGTMEDVEQI